MAELVVKDAEKWFRREDGQPFKVIDRLSFEARAGSVTVLIGPSGCGKSTLLNAIVGLEALDRGELRYSNNGQTAAAPIDRLRVSKPALVAVENHWREHCVWRSKAPTCRRLQWKKRVEHYLQLVGLDEYINQYPLYLSGGQRQRVGLARALAVESDLVLMDEPFRQRRRADRAPTASNHAALV